MPMMRHRSLTVSYAALMLVWPCSQAWAIANACSPRDDVVKQLFEKYHEAPVAIGLASNGNLLEVLTAADGSTWTMIQTSPAGISCLVAAGESWQQSAPPAGVVLHAPEGGNVRLPAGGAPL